MDNIELLKYCIKNPEKFLDYNYIFPERDVNLNFYKRKTIEIKELLIAIKRVRSKKNSQKIEEQLFSELQQKLKKYANYSEFGCFINACDSNINENISDPGLLRKITYLYLQKRNICDITPIEWIQAIIDKGSSRKKGHAGENKLIKILEENKFSLVKKMKDFTGNKKCVAKFSSSGDFSNKNIKKNFGISIGQRTQGKKLDLLIKKDKDIYFLEAKHLNTGGGEQSKQVLELIEIIKQRSPAHCHFVSFLDGLHSNNILGIDSMAKKKASKTKEEIQYRDIKNTPIRNKGNYWINTAGFVKLFS